MKILALITFLLYIAFFGFLGMNAYGEDEVDRLSLAALLIKNKNYSRANAVLSEIKDPHEVVPERYYSLKGILELKQKRFQEALLAFKNAEKEGLKGKELALGLAQAYLGLKENTKGLEVLKNSYDLVKTDPLFYQLKASLLFENKNPVAAWRVLNAGLEKFKTYLPLMKQKWFYLMENNLIEVSFEAAKKMVDGYKLSALDIARIGQIYRQKGDTSKAIYFGEMARLKDPKDEEIIKDLARSYLKGDKVLASAQLFTSLSHYYPEYLVESSELWRKAGYLVYAERLALEIRDPVKKFKTMLTLALLQEDFTKMALIGERAIRTELKEDQDIRYALAYAHFMNGEFDKTKFHLKSIGRNDLFKKAVALREAIESCTSGEKLCL